MCLLLHQGSHAELGPLLSTGSRSAFIGIGARTQGGQARAFYALHLSTQKKGKRMLEMENPVVFCN